MNILRLLSFVCLLSVVSACSFFRPASSASSTNAPANSGTNLAALSDRLRRVKLTDLQGRPFNLALYYGKPVFLNFWATWCGPCIQEMESIEAVYQQYKGKVIFLAVTTEEPEKIEAFRKKYPYTFDFARLEGDYLDAFVVKLPTTMLITRDGTLLYEEEGYRVWTMHNNLEKVKEIAK